MPSPAAATALSTDARTWAPNRVFTSSMVRTIVMTTTTPIRKIRYAPRSSPSTCTCPRSQSGRRTGCCDGPKNHVAAATDMNTSPIENITWSRCVAL